MPIESYDGISKQQYKVTPVWTHWERVPTSSTGRVELVNPTLHTKSDVAIAIDYLWMNFLHCKHDTTDTDGSAGKTITEPNGRQYTTGTHESTLDLMYCAQSIKVPRGMMGICARSECPYYEPIKSDTWNFYENKTKTTGQIKSTSGSGYLCYPSDHEIRYARKNPDNLPSGSWTAYEILYGPGDGLSQRKIWTFKGGGNIVGRPAWMNVRIGEIGASQWNYQRLAHRYDVISITSGAMSGQKYMIKRAIACYAHHSDYQTTGNGLQSAFPTDILNPTDLNLPISSGSDPSIVTDFFKLDYLEIYNADGTALKTDIPVDSTFDILPIGACAPHEEVNIKVFEIVDNESTGFTLNTFGTVGDYELTKGKINYAVTSNWNRYNFDSGRLAGKS